MSYMPDHRLSRAIYFLSRTIKQQCLSANTPCMLWQGATDANGYPRAAVLNKPCLVRRYVYETFHGSTLPYLKSKCVQRLCINPDHQRPA